MIYLDNNATTAVDPLVREAMWPYLGELYGNPSSTHRFGQESRQAVEEGRHRVAGLLGCDVREVIFTSGGTESDNAAIHGVLAVRAPRRVIVTSTVEHSAVRTPVEMLGKMGFEVVEVGVDERWGALDFDLLSKVLSERGAEVRAGEYYVGEQ